MAFALDHHGLAQCEVDFRAEKAGVRGRQAPPPASLTEPLSPLPPTPQFCFTCTTRTVTAASPWKNTEM